jgi:hypothetical protein
MGHFFVAHSCLLLSEQFVDERLAEATKISQFATASR